MPPYIANSPNSDASSGVSQYLSVLSRRKTVIVLTAATVLALFTPFVLGLPSLYRANATVIVEGQLPEGVLSGVGGELDNRLQAIKQEALSRAHLTELLDEFHLYPKLRGKVPIELLLSQLQRDIKIDFKSSDQASAKPTTVAFTITYTGKDPETAAGVANRLASFYVAQNDTIRSRQATQTTEVLRQQLSETKKRLDGQEAKIQDFLTRHMGRLPQQMDANLLAITRLNGQLQFNAEQQSKLMERRQELQKSIADLDMTMVSATASAASADPVVKLATAKRELADLQSRFNDSYPDVRDKKAEVARLEKEVSASNGRSPAASAIQGQRAMLSTALKEVEAKLDDLSKESRGLRSQSTSYEGRVESAPARGPEYDALVRDYPGPRDAYDQLLKKYDEARLVETLEHNRSGQEFRILDAALPPPFAAGPNRTRLLVLALLMAIVLAIAAAIAVDRMDTSFHTIDDLRSFTQVPVLASIPRITTPRDRRNQRVRRTMVAAAVAATLVLLASGAFHYAHGSDGVARLLLQVG